MGLRARQRAVVGGSNTDDDLRSASTGSARRAAKRSQQQEEARRTISEALSHRNWAVWFDGMRRAAGIVLLAMFVVDKFVGPIQYLFFYSG
jgi:hypothetical protein